MPERSRITPICQQSALLNLMRAHGEQPPPPANQPSICLHFLPRASFANHKKKLVSFYILVFLHVFLPFFSSLLANLISLPPLSSLPCSPPLTPQLGSTIRWQWQCSAWCVCVCDVTPQQLYSSTLFLILVLTDHSAIFRFYKPFQKSFEGNA